MLPLKVENCLIHIFYSSNPATLGTRRSVLIRGGVLISGVQIRGSSLLSMKSISLETSITLTFCYWRKI